MLRGVLLFLAWLGGSLTLPAYAEDVRGMDGIAEVKWEALSDRNLSSLGTAALRIRPGDWKHAESTNFIYHFFQGFIATATSVEAEFYYRVISKELDRDTTQWERKSHIFIFERPEDWAIFQKLGSLDRWTGALHSGHELFIQRDPGSKFKGSSLGHEVAHLVIHRFFGAGVPLWLNEGYAEYASSRAYASYHRARGYAAKPYSNAVAMSQFIPLERLTNLAAYPESPGEVAVFYDQSHRLVRLLYKESRGKFLAFIEACSKGNRFDTALGKAYGGRFPTVGSLEQELKTYASKDHGSSLQD